jgi:hypothetical protein
MINPILFLVIRSWLWLSVVSCIDHQSKLLLLDCCWFQLSVVLMINPTLLLVMIVISLELFDSRPLNLHLLDLVLVVYITCCSFCVLSYFQVLIEI